MYKNKTLHEYTIEYNRTLQLYYEEFFKKPEPPPKPKTLWEQHKYSGCPAFYPKQED